MKPPRKQDVPASPLGPTTAMDRAIAWYLRGPMIRVLYGVAALCVVIFMLMAQTVMAQRQARQEVMLQDESMLSLNALMEILLDAETGQRGYLLTGNATYLDPYERAKARLEPELGALHRMAERSGDEEQAHIGQVEKLIRAKVDEMDRTVDLERAGLQPTALAVVATNTGEQAMDRLRQELAWLRGEKTVARQAAFDRVQLLESRLLPPVGVLGIAIVLIMLVALRGESHRAWAEAEARQIGALHAANEETQLLARELNHRVKNLFSVVLSIIAISSRKQAPIAVVLDDIRARVHALSLAHSSSQGFGSDESAKLSDLTANIMRPYAQGDATRVSMTGPDVVLTPRMVTPMGLLIHELATNASKYGALSVESGLVEIIWSTVLGTDGSRELVFDWRETGGPPLTIVDQATAASAPDGSTALVAMPGKAGFGSRLTAMAAQQLGGTITRSWPQSGACVNLICPLP